MLEILAFMQTKGAATELTDKFLEGKPHAGIPINSR